MSEFEEHKLEQETELKRRQELLVKKIHEVFGYGAKGGLQISGASINRFDLVKEFPGATLHGSMNVSCGPHIVRLQYIRTFSRMKLPRGQEMHFHDLFPVCCFPVNIDFGRSIIRTETISDKIAELFVPCEHDFEEYRYFSWKYCCFSNDPEKLRAALNEENNRTVYWARFENCCGVHEETLSRQKLSLHSQYPPDTPHDCVCVPVTGVDRLK